MSHILSKTKAFQTCKNSGSLLRIHHIQENYLRIYSSTQRKELVAIMNPIKRNTKTVAKVVGIQSSKSKLERGVSGSQVNYLQKIGMYISSKRMRACKTFGT